MNLLGKRYVCPECGGVVLITKPGDGTIECAEHPLEQLDSKKLPSSD